MKNNIKRTERGWAGHFCAAANCRFRRNTLIEYGSIKVVISTVGNYYPSSHSKGMEEIGVYRYYETMAFFADNSVYLDADVEREIDFESQWAIGDQDVDGNVETIDNIANNMHENVVNEMIDRLINDNLSYCMSDEG